VTEKLFLKDSYLKSCDAEVTTVTGAEIMLDRTVFYPQGGGQQCDLGKIIRGAEEFNVVLVKNSENGVLHTLDRQGLNVGDKVRCEINWDRRYKFMRMHTSAHIIAAVLFKENGALITGNQLGETDSRMDFSVENFDRVLLKSVEDKANEIVQKNYSISVSFEDREKALERKELFRLKDVLPKDIPIFRILSIGNFDIQADGGTHVKSTIEVGKIIIFDMKNKGAENRRIYWKLE
jgi:Ser-tRNA(Ala) deacylase AlaX